MIQAKLSRNLRVCFFPDGQTGCFLEIPLRISKTVSIENHPPESGMRREHLKISIIRTFIFFVDHPVCIIRVPPFTF